MGAKISTPPYSKDRGAWLARASDTVYLAATDGHAICYTDAPTLGFNIIGYTDNANPPVTKRQHQQCSRAGDEMSFVMPVKKGDYWEITSATNVFWIPLEP